MNHVCTMWKALKHSTNTVYYAIGKTVHPDNIINMAYDLGINHIWSDVRCNGQRQDLVAGSGSKLFPKCVGGEVAFGQFGVAVQDVANVMATFANHGTKATEHFVESVTQGFEKKPIISERIVLAKSPLTAHDGRRRDLGDAAGLRER